MSTTAGLAVVTSFPLVPLTTTFEPPPQCSGIYLAGVAMIDFDMTCLPSGFDVEPTNYFSPGIACPSGYETACFDSKGVESITTVTCCPTRGDIHLSCVDDPATLSSLWSTLFCTWIAPESSATVEMTVSDNGITRIIRSTMHSPEGINAYGIRMVHEATDLATSGAESTHTSETESAHAGETSRPPADSPGPSSSSKGLSTGATAAIAVVVSVVGLALIGGLVFWLRKRKQRLTAAQQGQEGYTQGADVYKDDRPGEYSQSPPQEMWADSQHPMTELPTTLASSELPGESRR